MKPPRIRLSRPDWTTGDRGRFLAASALGAAAGAFLFALIVTRGRLDLLQWQRSGNFYDAQAQAWLHGKWDIREGILGIEKFRSHGRAYMYQGPWPALLRLPISAVTTRFDGRLTQLSMILASIVAMAGATRLHWRVRGLLRPGVPVRRADLVTAALTTFVVGGGSAILYEASRAWVYQEAAMWGAAWSIVAIDAVVGCVQVPSRRRFLWTALVTTLAMCSRSSVGLGAVAALAILAGGNLLARGARPTGGFVGRTLHRFRWAATARRPNGRAPVVAPAIAAFVPLAVYSTINYIKFRTLFSIPFWTQGFTDQDEQRQHFLAVNGGTLFGFKWFPTTLVQYLRPDALRFTRAYPFVDFPPPARPFGGVQFDLVDYSSSIPSSMPLLTILAIVGLVVLVRRSRDGVGTGASVLRVPALGALAGAVTILPFAYIANRYLADAVPALLILGLVGFHHLLSRLDGERPSRPRWVRPTFATFGVLLLAGVWINISLALIFGRLYSSDVKDDVAASFVDTRYDVAQSLGLDPVIPLRRDEELPIGAPRGQIAIIGDCEAMYLADGMPLNAVKATPWNPLERSELGGRYLRRITFPIQPPGTRLPLFTMTSSEGDGQLFAEWQGGAGVEFDYEGPGSGFGSPTLFLPPERTYTLDLVADRRLHFVQIWLNDVLSFQDYYRPGEDEAVTIGADVLDDPQLADRYTGLLDPLPERTSVCKELQREASG